MRWIAGALVAAAVSGTALGQAGRGPTPGSPAATSPGGGPATGPASDRASRPVTNLVDLRPRFERGQVIRFVMNVDSSTDQEIGTADDQPLPGEIHDNPKKKPRRPGEPAAPEDLIKNSVEFGLVMKVREVGADGTAIVDLVIDSMKAKSAQSGDELEFDSTKPAKKGDEIDKGLRVLVGTTMTMTVDRTGNITRVTGGEQLAMLGGSLTASGGGGLPGMPGSSGKGLFQSIFPVSSGPGQVQVGQEWKDESVIDSALIGEFRIANTHRLASAGGGTATVETKGTIKATSDNPAGPAFQVKDSTLSGRYQWDTQTGMLREMTQTMQLTIDGTLMGQAMKSTSSSTMRVRRVR